MQTIGKWPTFAISIPSKLLHRPTVTRSTIISSKKNPYIADRGENFRRPNNDLTSKSFVRYFSHLTLGTKSTLSRLFLNSHVKTGSLSGSQCSSALSHRFIQTAAATQPTPPTTTTLEVAVPRVIPKNALTVPAFAIIHLGGIQFKVAAGDVLISEKIEAPVGSEIVLDKILLLGTETYTIIGKPLVDHAHVHAIVEEQTRTKKIIVFKKKKRKNYRRTKGHRQPITTLRIQEIVFDKEAHQIEQKMEQHKNEPKPESQLAVPKVYDQLERKPPQWESIIKYKT